MGSVPLFILLSTASESESEVEVGPVGLVGLVVVEASSPLVVVIVALIGVQAADTVIGTPASKATEAHCVPRCLSNKAVICSGLSMPYLSG